MRILFLAAFGRCNKQTVGRRLLPLARAMAARGHVVELLIPRWDCPDAAQGSTEVRGLRVRTLSPGPGAGGVYPWLGLRVWRAVRAFAPDWLIVSKGLGYAGLAMRAWLNRGGRAVLDVDDLEDARGWGATRPRLIQRILARQEARLARDASGIIVASHFLATHWRQQSGHSPSDVHYCANGLTPAVAPAPVAENPPHVLLLTRGHDVDERMLRRVWPAILARVPEARLLIAGGWETAPTLPQSTRLGWLHEAAYIQTLRKAALALFLPPDTPLVRAKSPARLLDCLAQGLPVATLDVGDYAALASVAGGTIVATEEDLVSWTVTSLRSPHSRAMQGREIWRRADAHSWPRRAAALDAWLATLL